MARRPVAHPVQAEAAQADRRLPALGQVGQELAEERAELEGVPAGAAPDDDPPDPVEDEVGVGGVVVDAALRGHRLRIERREEAGHGVLHERQLRRVVAGEWGRIRRIEGVQRRARRVVGHLVGAGVRAVAGDRQAIEHVVSPLNEDGRDDADTVSCCEVGHLGDRRGRSCRGGVTEEPERGRAGAVHDDVGCDGVPLGDPHDDRSRGLVQRRHTATGADLEPAGLAERTQAFVGGQHAGVGFDEDQS